MAAPKAKSGSSSQRYRMLNDKQVKPVLFNGRAQGGGKYMAGEVDGKLVLSDNGQPEYYNRIGELV
jgi:hypothetical protein